MNSHLCKTCGAHFAAAAYPPTHCPICEDERQYVPQSGQAWVTYKSLQANHRNTLTTVVPKLYSIGTVPRFAIGQRALLLQTEQGNILWDCTPLIDDAMVRVIKQLGGIRAIAISHPHFYSSMLEWSAAFGNAPIFLHTADRAWVQRKSPAIHYWDGTQHALSDGVTLHNLGGHFPGSSVLHWRDGADGKGVLLTGDTIYPVSNRRQVTFMYSYPNLLPLPSHAVSQLVDRLDGVAFEQLYAAWDGVQVTDGARQVVLDSAERYVAKLAG